LWTGELLRLVTWQADLALRGQRSSGGQRRSGELLRLGLLMSMTMTLHNLPEGFAVAFSSFTDIGVVMAAAIAMHNVPEVCAGSVRLSVRPPARLRLVCARLSVC
jgi:zinc transporter ZupT